MDTGILIVVGIGFLVTVVSLLLVMFAMFFIARDTSDNKRVSEQNFIQTQLNNARLLGMERQVNYMHDVIKREELAQSMMNTALTGFGAGPGGLPAQTPFPPGTTFQNEDGSIKAGSMEELLDKMTQDPRYGKSKKKDLDFLDGLFNRDDEEDES